MSNVCASKLNSNTNFILKKTDNLKLGPRWKNYRTGWDHSQDLEQIQLEVAGEVLLYTSDLPHLEFPYFINTLRDIFGQIQHFFKVLKTDFEIQYFQYRVETLLSVRFVILLCSVIWLIN